MAKSRFFSYLGRGGTNYIQNWIDQQNPGFKAKFDVRIQMLEHTDGVCRPHWAYLKHECKGLIEIRVLFRKIQYRPLCCHGLNDGQIVLLAGAIEKDSKFLPKGICKTALERKKRLFDGEGCINEYLQ